MQTNAPTTAAPSAATEAAPATAAAASPAPSAAKPLTSVAEAVERAMAMRPQPAPVTAPPVTPSATPNPAGAESPTEPEASASPTATEPASAAEVDQTPTESTDPDAAEEAELAEAEGAKDPEKLLSALRKERAKAKELKQQLKEAKAGSQEAAALKARLDQLEAKLAQPEPQPQPEAQSVPVTAPPQLADCETIEAVDARVMLATTAETLALELQRALVKNDVSAVTQRLAAEGFKTVDGVPVSEPSEQQLEGLLNTLYANARRTIAGADLRKRELVQTNASAGKAVELIPALAQRDSAESQQFWAIVQQNPWLKQAGPRWPELVATQMLGLQAKAAKTTAPKTVTPERKPTPAPRTIPGPPKTSTAALPATSEIDAIRAKQKAGTATVQDMIRLQTLQTA